MNNPLVNNQNLFLKLHLDKSVKPVSKEVTVNWHLAGSNYRFGVGNSYLPTTLIINKKGILKIGTDNDCYNLINNSSLVINENKKFSITCMFPEPSDVLIVFFAKEFVRKNLIVSNENGIITEQNRNEFFEKVNRCDAFYGGIYDNIISNFNIYRYDELFLNEKANELFSNIISYDNAYKNEIKKLPFKRKSTKIEVYKRLNRALEYIENSYMSRISLDDIAKQSAISKFHLLRLFKSCFKVTPYEYISNLRIKRAKELLEFSDKTISEICNNIGFESLPAFSAFFSRNYGINPTEFRRICSPLKKAI
jgi:AraC-like DNA-binding protein